MKKQIVERIILTDKDVQDAITFWITKKKNNLKITDPKSIEFPFEIDEIVFEYTPSSKSNDKDEGWKKTREMCS